MEQYKRIVDFLNSFFWNKRFSSSELGSVFLDFLTFFLIVFVSFQLLF